MELLKGLNKDFHPSKLSAGHWSNARNMVVNTKYRDLTNEEGFVRNEQFGKKTVVGYIEVSDRLVLFSVENGKSEIGIIDKDDNYTIIVKDTTLGSPGSPMGFSVASPISGTFTFNYRRELIIVWWEGLADDANPPRTINLECLPFDVNVDKTLVDPTEWYLTKLFPDIGCATIDLLGILDSGGNLQSGAYQFMYAYELSDGTITNYSGITNWVSVIDSSSSEDFNQIDGVEADTTTKKIIRLQLTNLDDNYPKVVIAIIRRIGGVISVARTQALTITTGGTIGYDYINDDNLIEESLGNIIVPTDSYTHVKTGVALGNRLYLANLRKTEELDYQAYANNISIEWVREDDVNLAAHDGSFKDPVYIFDKKSFMSGEAYAFYIIFKLKDGTFSSAYHIPGRAIGQLTAYGTLPENSRIADLNAAGHFPPDYLEFLAIDADARYHEVYSTALQTNEMGVFENQGETYADNDCWDVKDSGGNVIGNIRNENVRHHVFPSIDQLETWGNPFFSPSTGISGSELLLGVPSGWGANTLHDFTTSSVNAAYFTVNTIVDEYEIQAVVDVLATVDVNIIAPYPSIKMQFNLWVEPLAGNDIYLKSEEMLGSIVAGRDTFTYSGAYNFNTGDKLKFSVEITGSPVVLKPNLTGGLRIKIDNFAESDGVSTLLGVKLLNVNIPTEIKDRIECYHLCYAKRTTSNSLKVGTGLLSRLDNIGSEFNFANFDILSQLPGITPSYVKTQLEFNSLTDPNGYHSLLFDAYIQNVNVRKITDSFYLPANVSIPSNNLEKPLAYYIETDNVFLVVGTNIHITELYNYYKNVYSNFTDQELVLAGKPIDVSINNTANLYNGDIFLNVHGASTSINKALLGATKTYLYPTESIANIGYRHGDEIADLLYCPKDGVGYNDDPYFGEYYGYNTDYSAINNTIALLVAKCVDGCSDERIDEFPFRIHRSSVVGEEARDFGWRKFRTNEYKEMSDRAKGEINVLAAFNKVLLIYQRYSMFMAQFRDVLYTNDVETYLGTGDIFTREPDEVLPDTKGYAGNSSQWCTFACKHGVIHVDEETGKVFLFNGKLKEISATYLRNYFREFGTRISDIDNPFSGQGYSGTFCEKTNRIIISSLGTTLPLTASFSFDLTAWVSLHDHFGNAYMNTRFASYNVFGNYLYKMDEGNMGEFSNYLPDSGDAQIIHDSYIDVVFAEPFDVTKVIEAIYWDTVVYDKNYNTPGIQYDLPVLYDKTIDKIVIYNDDQISGTIDLINGKNLIRTLDNLRNAEYTWKFNAFRDMIIDRNLPILEDDGTINALNIKTIGAWFDKSKFISKFVVVRLIIDNNNNLVVNIQHVSTNLKKSNR